MRYLLIFCFVSSLIKPAVSQINPFDLIFPPDMKKEYNLNCKSYVERTYQEIYSEDEIPDTMLFYDDRQIGYKLTEETFYEILGSDTLLFQRNIAGKPFSEGQFIWNKGSLVTSQEMSKDEEIAVFVNNIKTLSYDSTGRLLAILEQKCAGCENTGKVEMIYSDQSKYPAHVNIEKQALGGFVYSKTGDKSKIIYEVDFTLSDDFITLVEAMGKNPDSEKPKMNYEIYTVKDTTYVDNFSDRNNAKEMLLVERFGYNSNGTLLLNTSYYEGQPMRSIKYLTDTNGKVVGIGKGEEVIMFEFDKEGRVLISNDGLHKISHEYDKNGNVTQITTWDDYYPSNFTVRENKM